MRAWFSAFFFFFKLFFVNLFLTGFWPIVAYNLFYICIICIYICIQAARGGDRELNFFLLIYLFCLSLTELMCIADISLTEEFWFYSFLNVNFLLWLFFRIGDYTYYYYFIKRLIRIMIFSIRLM